MRSFNLDLHDVPGSDVEMNVGAIGVSVIFGACQFHLCVEQAAFLQLGGEVVGRARQRSIAVPLTGTDGDGAGACQKGLQAVRQMLLVR